MMVESRAVPSSGYPPIAQAWAVIAILALVTLFSQLDRQLPALLVRPLKAEFTLSDTQFLSLIHI